MTAAPTPEELAGYDFNDFGNAMRLIRLAGGAINADGSIDISQCRLLFLHGTGWVAYQGHYWDREMGEHHAWRFAHGVGIAMQGLKNELIKRSAGATSDTPIQKFIDSCGSSGATRSMLAMAMPYLTVRIEDFDRQPLTLNCRNGTVWLTKTPDGKVKRQIRPHNPADRITRYIDLDYDPKATAPLFESTLSTSLPEDDKRDFFQRALGYSATGIIYEQAFFMCQGVGGDGKSTLLAACRKALGGFGGAGDSKTFLDIGQVSSAAASPDLAELAGDTRLVVLSEAKRDVLLNEALLKQWTGGEPVPARALHGKPFKFIAIGKLWWQFNGWPKAQGNDDGLWRRLFPIVFEHQVPEAERDRQLPDKLEKELAGILNWLIVGIEAWLATGLAPPKCVLDARDRYRKQSSPFLDWLTTNCIYGKAAGDSTTSSKALYDNFKEWFANQGGDKVMSSTSFGRAMGERQIDAHKRNGNIYRKPIRLKTIAELTDEFGPPEPSDPTSASVTQSGEIDLSRTSPFDVEDDRW